MKDYNGNEIELITGNYYWVLQNKVLFIAQYEGDYWQTDISVAIDEFNRNTHVIQEVKKPKDFESYKVF